MFYLKTINRLKTDAAKAVPYESKYLAAPEAQNRRVRSHKPFLRFAASFVTVSLVTCFFLIMKMNTGFPINLPNNSTQGPASTTIVRPGQHDFILTAYAASPSDTDQSTAFNESSTSNNTRGIVLAPNLQVTLPWGKISVSGKDTRSVRMDSGAFVCTGEDIISVTYSVRNGTLHFYDEALSQQLEDNSQLYVCEIPLPDGYADSGAAIETKFKTDWNGGKFDSYKFKYFSGKSTELSDYDMSITFSTGKSQELTKIVVKIGTNKTVKQEISQDGTTVTVKSGSRVVWSPSQQIVSDLLNDKNVDLTSYPPSMVKVSATFTDNKTVTKTVSISFDKKGNLIATLRE